MATEAQLPTRQDSFDVPRTPPNPPGPAEVSLLDLLLIMARRRRMILLTTLAFALISTAVAFLLPNQYTAEVLVLPPRQSSSLSSLLESQLGGTLGSLAALSGGGSLGLRNPNDMYVAMFKSQTVEDAMVTQFGLMKEYHKRYLSQARKAFEKHIDVDGSGKDELIHVSVRDRNPERAAQLANAYVDQFRRLSQHLAVSAAGERADFFYQQLQQAKEKLADAEEALKQTEISTGLIELSSQARALIESAASLRAQIAAKKVQIQALETFASGDNAQLIQAQQELASLQAQLGQLGGSDQSANSLIVPKGKIPQAALEYARRLRDVQYYQTIFEVLARQYELAKLDQAKEGSLVQVVSPAIVPDRKSSPYRGLIILGSTLAGLLLAAAVALIQSNWSRMKADPEIGMKLAMLHESLRRKSPAREDRERRTEDTVARRANDPLP